MKHVLGILIAGTATFSAQSSVLVTRTDFEIPLLIVWGVALLAFGQRVKAAGRQEPATANRATCLPSGAIQAGA